MSEDTVIDVLADFLLRKGPMNIEPLAVRQRLSRELLDLVDAQRGAPAQTVLHEAVVMAENRLEAALLGDEICKHCVGLARSYLTDALSAVTPTKRPVLPCDSNDPRPIWEQGLGTPSTERSREPATPAVGGEARNTLWGQIAAIYEGADDVDAAWVDREWMKMRGITAAQPDSPLLARARQFVADSGCDEDDNEVNAARDELLADMDVSLGKPDGWKLVPTEPTKEMITAGDMLTYSQERFKVSEVYRAMVSAASPPEQPAPLRGRDEAIEECAKLIESGAGMADLIDQEELDQQAKYIRALYLQPAAAPVTGIQPHIYSPDYQAMGDCRVCGHERDKPWHDLAARPAARAERLRLT